MYSRLEDINNHGVLTDYPEQFLIEYNLLVNYFYPRLTFQYL